MGASWTPSPVVVEHVQRGQLDDLWRRAIPVANCDLDPRSHWCMPSLFFFFFYVGHSYFFFLWFARQKMYRLTNISQNWLIVKSWDVRPQNSEDVVRNNGNSVHQRTPSLLGAQLRAWLAWCDKRWISSCYPSWPGVSIRESASVLDRWQFIVLNDYGVLRGAGSVQLGRDSPGMRSQAMKSW